MRQEGEVDYGNWAGVATIVAVPLAFLIAGYYQLPDWVRQLVHDSFDRMILIGN